MPLSTGPEIEDRLTAVFRDVMDDDSLELSDGLTAQDVEGWDSLNHINLVVAIERAFKIKFTTAEVSSLKNVGELAALIQKKLAKR